MTEYFSKEKETAMRTKMASLYATLVLGYLENTTYEDSTTKFGEEIGRYVKEKWLRYLDDWYMNWKFGEESLKQFRALLNHLNPNTKFTIEHSTKQLAFLDILVQRDNDILTTDINYTAADTRKHLDFTSNHPRHIKNIFHTN